MRGGEGGSASGGRSGGEVVKWVGEGEVACHVVSTSPKYQSDIGLNVHVG